MWSAYVVESVTGRLGAQLPLRKGAGAFDRAVNGPWTVNVGVPTRELLRIPEARWEPWAASVLICLHGEPFQLGPVLDDPQGDRDIAMLSVGGFQDFMRFRQVTAGDFGPGQEDALKGSTAAISGKSRGDIGWDIIQYAMQRPGGALPVVHGQPEQPAGNQRNYHGWNLANNSAANRLKLLAETDGGPNIAFPVEWVPGDRRRVQWVYMHGTEGHPWIPQPAPHLIDLTAPQTAGTAIDAVTKSQYLTRVYGTGAGQDEGTLIRTVETEGHRTPFLEDVWSDSQIDNPDLLTEKARALLGGQRVIQLALETPIVLGAPFPGQQMTVRWPHGFPRVPGGPYHGTVIKQSGTLESGIVKYELQEHREIF